MKSVVLHSVVVCLSLVAMNAFGQSACQSGGGEHPGVAPASPYGSPGSYPTAEQVQAFLSQSSANSAAAVDGSPTAPQARITVVDPAEDNLAASAGASAAPSSVRITVVPDAGASRSNSTPQTSIANDPPISEELKGLVGNWTAVARVGDGELTTVELQLDDRGWATLTVPSSDGKRSTIKRRVELKNDEIKLKGPEAETVLGKLVSVSSRQMVLEKASGQVTFVRI